LFDGIYTGTETRDPSVAGNIFSNMKAILSFAISKTSSREAMAAVGLTPGGLSCMDRYAEQLWLTLFAKAPEITLFDFRQCSGLSFQVIVLHAGVAHQLRL